MTTSSALRVSSSVGLPGGTLLMADDGVIGDECESDGVPCVCVWSIGADIPAVVTIASDMLP